MSKVDVKTTVPNAQVKVAKVEQTGDKDFGLEPKVLYYLMVITDKGTLRMNIGEKAHNTLKEML
jgi:hypothetical protein